MFECEFCSKVFTRADNRNRHIQNSCKNKRIKLSGADGPSRDGPPNCDKCELCNIYVEKKLFKSHFRTNMHKNNAFTLVDDGVEKIVGAYGDRIISYRITESSKHYVDIEEFAYNVREKIATLIETITVVHNSVKVNLELFALYYLLSNENVELKSFNTRNKIINPGSDFYEIYDDYIGEIKSKMSEFNERDSGKNICLQYIFYDINKIHFRLDIV